ncbi:polysaccharide export protein [Pseudohalioglobus sediminis]|uniref:Polysaccharide export protein n=1 Tax=Pseudohalioglobus sediminis TaxID=2606449 RepID=A0A5B0WVQ9_9GAMM|nr:polysaccharide biosynthesis/export family protein [Pseudohalioglobus sediminis]KAA1189969.1 polysaccharide export protein [Pseudohalioglobus sediminis]
MSFSQISRLILIALGLSLYSSISISDSYTVNPGDLLRIDVWNEESLSREVLVRPDGIVSLPMAGEVDTTNTTPSVVADKISKALGKYMKDKPRVVVSLVNVNGNKIYVIGKVERPGEYIVTSDTDVMQALALAGGLNAFAAENDIRILRRQPDGQQVAIPFRYARVKAGEALESNIVLQSKDVVVVP